METYVCELQQQIITFVVQWTPKLTTGSSSIIARGKIISSNGLQNKQNIAASHSRTIQEKVAPRNIPNNLPPKEHTTMYMYY